MSANKYIPVGVLVNSCLIGANAYRVVSDEAEFEHTPLEEVCDTVRQRPGHHYMRACTTLDKTELWMIPFCSTPDRLLTLQNAMEVVQGKYLGTPGFLFPFDIVEEETDDPEIRSYVDPEEEAHVISDKEGPDVGVSTAYVLRPPHRALTKPIRRFIPDAQAPRWTLAKNIFARVQQLHKMGLSSNGISREQLRVNEQTWEIELWMNHTMRLIDAKGPDMYHQGFGTIPVKTAKKCREMGFTITPVQRDIFSCAVLAFYLINYTHPFVGADFATLSRDEYIPRYHYSPAYIMDPKGTNHLGNQAFDREVQFQWEKITPKLKALFDGLFMEVTYPGSTKPSPEMFQKMAANGPVVWTEDSPWWNIDNWIEALEADAQENDNASSRSTYKFNNYLYRLA